MINDEVEEMLIATGKTKVGDDVIIIGLTEITLENLKRRKPIWIRHDTHSIPEGVEIAIVFGTNDEQIADEIRMEFPDLRLERDES